MFHSSLPIGRVLEDPYDLPPVILCYKLNGEWLNPERGGPVRMVVPEAYGFKSIKWLTHVVLTNLAHANDTYAEQNNDVDSPLKTFAATISVPTEVKAGEPISVSGYAQVGISGLSRVQVSMESNETPRPEGDPYFLTAPWTDATLLSPPASWNSLGAGRIPTPTHGFDYVRRPQVMAAPADQRPLGGRAPRLEARRVHLQVPDHRREGPRPAFAPAVPQIGACGDRIRGHSGSRVISFS